MGQMAMRLRTVNTVNTCFVARSVFLGPLKGQPEIETEGGFEDNTKEIGKIKLQGDEYLPFLRLTGISLEESMDWVEFSN